MRYFSHLFLTAVLLFLAGTVSAAPRTLRVGFFPKPGFNEEYPDHTRGGFNYEYLRMLAVYGNFRYEYLGFDKSWAQNMEMLARGEIDILPGAQVSELRKKQFIFTAPTGRFHS